MAKGKGTNNNAARGGGKGKGGQKIDSYGGKGKDGSKGKNGKGGNKYQQATRSPPVSQSLMSQDIHANVKTVQEIEAQLQQSKSLASSVNRREVSKQALEVNGNYCQVKKHSDMGCAVVSFNDHQTRDQVLSLVKQRAVEKIVNGEGKTRQVYAVDGVDVQWKEHFDKDSSQCIPTDIFLAWGRQAEKTKTLEAFRVAEAVDSLVLESNGRGGGVITNGLSLNAAVPPPPPPPLADQLLQTPMVPSFPDLYSQAMYAAQQQAFVAPNTLLETPPRTGNKMRAEAPTFTPPPLAPQFPIDNLQYNAINEFDHNLYADYYPQIVNGYGDQPEPERASKQMAIVDPKTGLALSVESPDKLSGTEPQILIPPVRKTMKIIDQSGNAIDTLGLLGFTAPTAPKKFTIIDPRDSSLVQAS